jgi:hypothetical protein
MADVIWMDRSLVISPVFYGLCKDKKAFKKALKHLGIKKKDRPDYLLTTHADATVHYFKQDNKITAVICMGDCTERSTSEIAGLLIHEAVHVWQEIKRNIGEYDPSSEFEAYSIQTIAQRLIEAFYE